MFSVKSADELKSITIKTVNSLGIKEKPLIVSSKDIFISGTYALLRKNGQLPYSVYGSDQLTYSGQVNLIKKLEKGMNVIYINFVLQNGLEISKYQFVNEVNFTKNSIKYAQNSLSATM